MICEECGGRVCKRCRQRIGGKNATDMCRSCFTTVQNRDPEFQRMAHDKRWWDKRYAATIPQEAELG